jgi:hypothetical protein
MKSIPCPRQAAHAGLRVPTVPVHVPFLAVAALAGAFTLGRTSARMCRAQGRLHRGAAGCGSRHGTDSAERGATA